MEKVLKFYAEYLYEIEKLKLIMKNGFLKIYKIKIKVAEKENRNGI